MKQEYLREIAKYENLLEAARNKLAGLEAAISAISGVPIPQVEHGLKVKSRRNIKGLVIDTIIRKGDSGVTAEEILIAAKEQGRDLQKSSVSSLLSRLKAENTLRFDGDRYYPKNVTPIEQMTLPKFSAINKAA